MATDLDRIIHEPVRLRIMMLLSGVDESDFNFLLTTLELTKGNLSSHMDRLEKAGYIKIIKSFNGKIPHTGYQLTKTGKNALSKYWAAIDEIWGLKEVKQQSKKKKKKSAPSENKITILPKYSLTKQRC